MNINNISYGVTDFFIVLISGILGYFVYDSVDGALGMILLTFFFSLCLLFAVIPFCGVIIHAVLMHFLVIPFVLNLTALEQTWLVIGFFWVYLVMGLLITSLMSSIVVLYKKER